MQTKNKPGRYEIDMTTGPILPAMVRYSLPLIASGVLQLLYNAADMIVVGRFSGAEALAAVSSTGSLINLLITLFIGMSVGTSVSVAHAVGANKPDEIHAGVHTGITLALIGGILVGVVGVAAGRQLLEWMGSPEDVIDLATLYIRIYFAGMPVNMVYLFGSAILRAVGDTRRPLYYLAGAGLVNICLNVVLVVVFHMSVAGVAIATVTAQGISAFLIVRCLMKQDGALKLDLRKLGVDRFQMRRVLSIGLPAGLQSSLFSIANVLIQSSVNSFGSIAMAGNGASASVEGFIYQAMNSVYQAAMTFTSQNMGAGQYKRVRRITWTSQGLVAGVGIVMGAAALSCGRTLLSLYNANPEVIEMGLIRMSVIAATYFICGMMDTMVGTLRGLGHSVVPMIISLTGACALRVVWIYTIFAANPSLFILYMSYPISWVLTGFGHYVTYFIVTKKLPREDRELVPVA